MLVNIIVILYSSTTNTRLKGIPKMTLLVRRIDSMRFGRQLIQLQSSNNCATFDLQLGTDCNLLNRFLDPVSFQQDTRLIFCFSFIFPNPKSKQS